MSDFEKKKRLPPTPAPAARHHHRHKTSGGAGKGAPARHDALSLAPDQHALKPGAGALSTYRDLPKPVPATTGRAVEPAPIKGEAREKRIATLRNYLWAQVTAGRMEVAEAEVTLMQFQEALDEGLPSYEE